MVRIRPRGGAWEQSSSKSNNPAAGITAAGEWESSKVAGRARGPTIPDFDFPVFPAAKAGSGLPFTGLCGKMSVTRYHKVLSSGETRQSVSARPSRSHSTIISRRTGPNCLPLGKRSSQRPAWEKSTPAASAKGTSGIRKTNPQPWQCMDCPASAARKRWGWRQLGHVNWRGISPITNCPPLRSTGSLPVDAPEPVA